MEFKIINKERKLLIGLACDVTLAEVQDRVTINLAEQFMSRRSEIKNVINTREVFGVSTDPEDYNPDTDQFEFFIGVEVNSLTEIPKDMVCKEIPSNEYVVFAFEGPAENAGRVHNYLYTEWLRKNEYQLSGLYNIEVYDERFKGPFSEESVTDIYFPIKKKEACV
ncbi:GyrI-like domain-containing protein [Cohnella candidum]|uniref:GyrI-like domain-containing protein n=1 Tax=Cohnella candidum TaxID=2674991 RepID=A0A3G3JWC7_9BACL|nr:GyrI-like domain-containing protein [Cohnella candidum]AYQ72494.1 GyrI-like domain-containing protein [Cohnella candidum]